MAYKNKKVTILSIDGGGIRGIIPAVILNHIEKELQRQSGDPNATLADYFDLMAGTSTGGILVAYYLLPPAPGQDCHSRYFASEAIDLYARFGKEIFKRRLMRFGVTKEKYPAIGMERLLNQYMGDVTLAQTRKNCIITAYDITDRKAVLFTSPEARKDDCRNFLMRDITRATSAAPVYFEVAAIRSLGGAVSYLIDGGVYAGNPTMCALVEANKTVFETCVHPAVNDLYILSIGTGKEKQIYDYRKAKRWGAIGWARPMLDILLSASAEVVDYQMQQLFRVAQCRDCYMRLEPELGKAKPEMDDASDENIRQLKNAGERFIDEHHEELDEIVYRLMVNNGQPKNANQ